MHLRHLASHNEYLKLIEWISYMNRSCKKRGLSRNVVHPWGSAGSVTIFRHQKVETRTNMCRRLMKKRKERSRSSTKKRTTCLPHGHLWRHILFGKQGTHSLQDYEPQTHVYKSRQRSNSMRQLVFDISRNFALRRRFRGVLLIRRSSWHHAIQSASRRQPQGHKGLELLWCTI